MKTRHEIQLSRSGLLVDAPALAFSHLTLPVSAPHLPQHHGNCDYHHFAVALSLLAQVVMLRAHSQLLILNQAGCELGAVTEQGYAQYSR